MQVLLAAAAFAAVFAGGYWMMKKVDEFLEENVREEEEIRESEGEFLRIGFSHPLADEEIRKALKSSSAQDPGAAAKLYGGTEEELIRELSCGKLDLVFLPADCGDPSEALCNIQTVRMACRLGEEAESGLSGRPERKNMC